jgi:hypothetical protein
LSPPPLRALALPDPLARHAENLADLRERPTSVAHFDGDSVKLPGQAQVQSAASADVWPARALQHPDPNAQRREDPLRVLVVPRLGSA